MAGFRLAERTRRLDQTPNRAVLEFGDRDGAGRGGAGCNRQVAHLALAAARRKGDRSPGTVPDQAGPPGGVPRDRDRPEMVPEEASGGLSREPGPSRVLFNMGPPPCSIIPFTCEGLWKDLGNDTLVSFAEWPAPDASLLDPRIELAEELLFRTVEDVESILKLVQLEPKQITIGIAPVWKRDVFRIVAAAGGSGAAVKNVMKNEDMRKRGKAATDAVKQCTNLLHRLPPGLAASVAVGALDEKEVFISARSYLEHEFGVPVMVVDAEETGHPKAAGALPFKPAIIVE